MLYVVLTMPTLNKAYLFIYLFIKLTIQYGFHGLFLILIAFHTIRKLFDIQLLIPTNPKYYSKKTHLQAILVTDN